MADEKTATVPLTERQIDWTLQFFPNLNSGEPTVTSDFVERFRAVLLEAKKSFETDQSDTGDENVESK